MLDKHSKISYLNAVKEEVAEVRDMIASPVTLLPDAEEICAIEVNGKAIQKAGQDMVRVAEELRKKYATV
jgi:hypothetical protein